MEPDRVVLDARILEILHVELLHDARGNLLLLVFGSKGNNCGAAGVGRGRHGHHPGRSWRGPGGPANELSD